MKLSDSLGSELSAFRAASIDLGHNDTQIHQRSLNINLIPQRAAKIRDLPSDSKLNCEVELGKLCLKGMQYIKLIMLPNNPEAFQYPQIATSQDDKFVQCN